MTLKIVSWNVNGIRSRIFDSKVSSECKKNVKRNLQEGSSLFNLINSEDPDIICFQETRISIENSKCFELNGYYSYFNESKLTGARDSNRYAGTCVFTKIKPNKVEYSIPDYDDEEGRIIIMYFDKFVLINVYTPNSGTNFEKRLKWQPAVLGFLACKNLKNKVIYCGDMNVAYRPDDIHFNYKKGSSYKKKTENIVGYLPEERYFISELFKIQFKDSFLEINKYPDNFINNNNPGDFNGFTWWDPRAKKVISEETGIGMSILRYKNIGWRIDYIFISNNINVLDSKVLKHIGEEYSPNGSDHAPIISTITI